MKKHLQVRLEAFGRNLRRLRVSEELTQEKLAEMAGIHPRVLQKIEAGQTNLLITTAERLQVSLKCDWNDLMRFGKENS